MPKKVLLIDDDARLGELLGEFFQQHDIVLSSCVTPLEGLKLAEQPDFDIIILDVMLPQIDGFETLRRLRQFSQTPVIMLTARGDTMDRIVGLELGADDYLPKPFEARELVARINSILKRTQNQSQDSEHLYFNHIEIDNRRGRVIVDEKEIQLTTQELEILSLLARNHDRIFSRDDLFEQLKGIDWDAFNRSIDVTISRIRQKLKDNPKAPRFIKTVFGKGYQFIGERKSC